MNQVPALMLHKLNISTGGQIEVATWVCFCFFYGISHPMMRQYWHLFFSVWKAMSRTAFLFPPSLALSVSICVGQTWACVCVQSLSLLDTPQFYSPGPPCGMLYSVGPMEEGHPGTQRELKHMHTNTLKDTYNTHTRTNMHTQTNTAVESHHKPLAGIQGKDEWCWKASV